MKLKNLLTFCVVTFIFISIASFNANGKTETEEIELKEPPASYGMDISFDRSELGVVDVYYYARVEKKMKVVIQNDTVRYIYNIFSKKEWTTYPLQLGNGTYTVSLYENTTGTKYKKISSKNYTLDLEDYKIVHLQSIQEINWHEDNDVIIYTKEMLEQAADVYESKYEDLVDGEGYELTERQKIMSIYEYILSAIEYDYEKINGLDYRYIPNIDETFDVGTGICYDYSALLASMLRSEGIPTRMIKGYANTSEVYHAWNEIFIDDEWIVVDTTYDAYMYQNRYKYTFEKDSEKFNKVKYY